MRIGVHTKMRRAGKEWKGIPLQENGEPMRLKGALKELFDVRPYLLQGWKRRAVVLFQNKQGRKGSMQKGIEVSALIDERLRQCCR